MIFWRKIFSLFVKLPSPLLVILHTDVYIPCDFMTENYEIVFRNNINLWFFAVFFYQFVFILLHCCSPPIDRMYF